MEGAAPRPRTATKCFKRSRHGSTFQGTMDDVGGFARNRHGSTFQGADDLGAYNPMAQVPERGHSSSTMEEGKERMEGKATLNDDNAPKTLTIPVPARPRQNTQMRRFSGGMSPMPTVQEGDNSSGFGMDMSPKKSLHNRMRFDSACSVGSNGHGGGRSRGRTRFISTFDPNTPDIEMISTKSSATRGKNGSRYNAADMTPLSDMTPYSVRSRVSSQEDEEEGVTAKLLADFWRAIRMRCEASTRRKKNTLTIKQEMMDIASESAVETSRLIEFGFLNEDICRVIYDEHQLITEDDEEGHELLCSLELDTRGGLNRVREVDDDGNDLQTIWLNEKYFWCFYLLLSVVFNLTSLLAMNLGIFRAFVISLKSTMEMLENTPFSNVTSSLANADNKVSSHVVNQSVLNKLVFEHIHDIPTQRIFLNIAALVALFEVSWIIVKVTYSIHLWWVFYTDSSEFRAYRSCRHFFFRILPQFSTFSSLKLMTRIHPSLLYNNYYQNKAETSWRATDSGMIISQTCFILIQLGCAFAALGAFAVKILAVGFALLDEDMPFAMRFGCLFSLMIQCMGAIMMEQVLQDRLLLFVFGGQDSAYEDVDYAYKQVYESLLAKQIWLDFWQADYSSRWQSLIGKLNCIVLLATFDHYDMQKLLIKKDEFDLLNQAITGVRPERKSVMTTQDEADSTRADLATWMSTSLKVDGAIHETDETDGDMDDEPETLVEVKDVNVGPILPVGRGARPMAESLGGMQLMPIFEAQLSRDAHEQWSHMLPEIVREPVKHTSRDDSREHLLKEYTNPSDDGSTNVVACATSKESCSATASGAKELLSTGLIREETPRDWTDIDPTPRPSWDLREDNNAFGLAGMRAVTPRQEESSRSFRSLPSREGSEDSIGMRGVNRALREMVGCNPGVTLDWASGDVV